MDAITQTHVLLVYPDMPPSFWSMKFAMEFHGRKALLPPLGLLTVAAMLPDGYDARLVDLNVRPLEDADLAWADLVMISAMMVQRASMRDVVRRCNRAGVRVVAGGPYPTSFHDELEGVDNLVLDEVEDTLPGFLRDQEAGVAKPVYRAPGKPDVTRTPIPRFDLLDMDAYHMMSLQFSRGCPFDCEFCDITKLFGRTPRTKTPEQMVDEFEALWQAGWRGGVFLVDDNFIGNQRKAMELLPAVARWQRARGYPFSLITEATVNLARNERLMDAMLEAGFEWVFLGIETPNPEALRKMKKMQNTRRRQDDYLLSAVRAIQHRGLAVCGGFIIGADGDGEESFDAQIDFIAAAGIPVAVVSLLTALKGTDLYERLKREGRLLDVESNGAGGTVELNFTPEMDPKILLDGYRRVLKTLYDPTQANYYERCLTMMRHTRANPFLGRPTHFAGRVMQNEGWGTLLSQTARVLYRMLCSKKGPAFARFLVKVVRQDPRLFPDALTLAAMGHHFEKLTEQLLAVHDFNRYVGSELDALQERRAGREHTAAGPGGGLRERRARALSARVQARYEAIHEDFRVLAEEGTLRAFRVAVEGHGEGTGAR